jgi:RHS repeat-associated protein
MKKLRLCFTYWKQLGKMTTMKMNRIIPVILAIVVSVTGSLVNAYSLNTSGKLHLDPKKNFLVSRAECLSGNTRYTQHFEYYKSTMSSSAIVYKYDDQKRLTKVIYPDLSCVEITYTTIKKDEQDYKRVIIKQRNGTIVTNDYDKSDRLVNRTIQKGEDVEGTTFENFDYDGLNRLNYAENDNFVVEFKFDPLNRVTEEKQRGKLLNYTYSVVNNLRKMTMKYPNDRLIEKNFDLLDRLSNIKQGDNEIANFKYIGRSYRLLSKQFGNGDAVSYLYDQGRRMSEKKAVNKNNNLINHYKHGYNKVHMKTYEQRMHENGIGDVFGYDAVYRLTSAKFNVTDPTAANPTDFERERSILLDHLDNITRIDETKNGETTQITTDIPPDTDYAKLHQYSRFDQWGLAYDKNGNLTQKGTQKMYHDYRNQMVRVTEGTTTTENKYDALGRRLQMIVNTGSQTKTENYYYAGHQVVEVRDANDQVKHQFIYGNGIDEVVRMDVYSGSTITPYYFHRNEIGSTTALTDADGQVVERYKYSLFGMPTFMDAAGNVIPKSSIGNNILFQGREYEPETNFYYFRARHLDPIMGRFLQTDPMGYQDSLNLYQALNMNPINFLDPFGLEITDPVLPGEWNPNPNTPRNRYGEYIGTEIHKSIGTYYISLHPGEVVFTNYFPIKSIFGKAGIKLPKTIEKGLEAIENKFNIKLKPDILNLDLKDMYEISSGKNPAAGYAKSRAEAMLKMKIMNMAGLDIKLGPINDPGVNGAVPAPGGVAVFFSPSPGVILYKYQKVRKVPDTKPVPVPVPRLERVLDKLKDKFRELQRIEERDRRVIWDDTDPVLLPQPITNVKISPLERLKWFTIGAGGAAAAIFGSQVVIPALVEMIKGWGAAEIIGATAAAL